MPTDLSKRIKEYVKLRAYQSRQLYTVIGVHMDEEEDETVTVDYLYDDTPELAMETASCMNCTPSDCSWAVVAVFLGHLVPAIKFGSVAHGEDLRDQRWTAHHKKRR